MLSKTSIAAVWLGLSSVACPVNAGAGDFQIGAAGVYAPPSEWEAHQALIERVERESAGLPQEIVTRLDHYPIAVSLSRCDYERSRWVADSSFRRPVAGYSCIMTVHPTAAPPYEIAGFFSHDGLDWTIFGEFRERLVAPADSYSIRFDSSEQNAKPVSLLYNGMRGAAYQDGYQPDPLIEY